VLYLRRSLGDGVLVNRAEDELGIQAGTLLCDAAELRAALQRGDVEAAVDRYRGDLLEGLFVADAPEFERWLAVERATLRSQVAAAVWAQVDDAEGRGDMAAAAERAGRALELAPLDERGVRRRMMLLAGAGNRAGAVQTYEEFARRLAAELELEPDPETRALAAEIRHDVPGGATVRQPMPQPSIAGALDRPAPEATEVRIPAEAPPAGARSARVRSRWARGAAYAGVVFGVVLALAAVARLGSTRGADSLLEPRRVVVLPFENRTGDPVHDPVGSMAADWIVQVLTGRGAIQVVPVRAALASGRAGANRSEPGAIGPDPRPLARETGAGTAVTGSYYRQGDSLYFQARITEVATNQVVSAVGPVGAPAASPLSGVDELGRLVLAALAPLSDERGTHVRVVRTPPSYEAYQAYVAGFESFIRRDVADALRLMEQAVEADSTFMMPAIVAAIMHMNLDNLASADSIARRIEPRRHSLGPLELATLDMVLAWLDGDNDAAYQATLRQARLAPGSISEFQVAEQARRLNRPGEAVRVLTKMGAERGELRGWFPYWRELANAHHMLGDHAAELRAARQARDLYPGNPRALMHEVQALAGLGRVSDVDRLVQERLGIPSMAWPNPGDLMAIAARELRAHGHEDAALTFLDRALEWHLGRPGDGRAPDSRAALGILLYDTGRWADARDIFSRLAAEEPDRLLYQGYLGVSAARLGDRESAERIDAWLRDLEQPYLWGAHNHWRARIAAISGEHERAVRLLQDAFAQGTSHGVEHHQLGDLLLLEDYPPYRALMRPKL
jgi:DNA-binding SARP family transcriptional activator/tetratricopeptide (TPR) repeat protein